MGDAALDAAVADTQRILGAVITKVRTCFNLLFFFKFSEHFEQPLKSQANHTIGNVAGNVPYSMLYCFDRCT
jgi:hypothetical protein